MLARSLLALLTPALLLLGLSGLAAPALGAPAPKVDICHVPPGNPANFHTITVSENALPAHLAHGDLAGACGDFCETLCDDGDACTQDACDDNEQCIYGPVDCTDGNACTEDLLCDPVDGCLNEPQVGLGCDDGDACTAIDACDAAGACVGAAIPNCCESINDCEDGDLCTDDDCVIPSGMAAGTCEHPPVDCSLPPDIECQVGFCDANTGDCGTTNVQDGTPCTDFAPDDAACDNGQCVPVGPECPCIDTWSNGVGAPDVTASDLSSYQCNQPAFFGHPNTVIADFSGDFPGDGMTTYQIGVAAGGANSCQDVTFTDSGPSTDTSPQPYVAFTADQATACRVFLEDLGCTF